MLLLWILLKNPERCVILLPMRPREPTCSYPRLSLFLPRPLNIVRLSAGSVNLFFIDIYAVRDRPLFGTDFPDFCTVRPVSPTLTVCPEIDLFLYFLDVHMILQSILYLFIKHRCDAAAIETSGVIIRRSPVIGRRSASLAGH